MTDLIINKVGFSHMKLNPELGKMTRRHMWEIFSSSDLRGFFAFETWGYKHGKGYGQYCLNRDGLEAWLRARFGKYQIAPDQTVDTIQTDLENTAMSKSGFTSFLAGGMASMGGGDSQVATTTGQAQRFLMSGVSAASYDHLSVDDLVRAAYGLSVDDGMIVAEGFTHKEPAVAIVRDANWGSW